MSETTPTADEPIVETAEGTAPESAQVETTADVPADDAAAATPGVAVTEAPETDAPATEEPAADAPAPAAEARTSPP